MHSMKFRVPTGEPPALADAQFSSSIGFGHDRAPAPARRELVDGNLILSRDINESGPAYIPWEVLRAGRLMATTTTLLLRDRPYHLVQELARGKINDVRNQYVEWRDGGLDQADEVEDLLRRATRHMGQSILDAPDASADGNAQEAIALAFEAANILVAKYRIQVYKLRHQRQPKLDSALGCRIFSVPAPGLDDLYRLSFNTANVALTWRSIETTESNYRWDLADAAVDWATDRNLKVFAGPIIDFSPAGLPDFVLRGNSDPLTFKSLMCDYVETVVNRYRGKVGQWLIATGANSSTALGMAEDDLVRLTAMAADAAWQIDPNAQIVFGLSQPWSDYLANPGFEYSSFVFADTLLRAGLPFAGIELEWAFGTSPGGSYCRDVLDASKLLDFYGMLGVPIQVSLSYPSSDLPDPNSDPGEQVRGAGQWGGISPTHQSRWTDAFASLAMCKSFVSGVFWTHLLDSEPHRFPNAGLVDLQGMIKPAFDRLRAIREEHLH